MDASETRLWSPLSHALILAACLFSCSTLPDYAAPRVLESQSVDRSDVVGYRTLTRADFKADAPPAEYAAVADRVGALTCCFIGVEPGAEIMQREIRSQSGAVRYETSVRNVRAFARMSRTCSWWNPNQGTLPQEYILEHEQIHFALCEIEARHLNRTLRELTDRPVITDEDPAAAGAQIQARISGELRERSEAVIARSRDFDEDTSLGHEPEAQKRWLAKVEAELAESQAYASPSR